MDTNEAELSASPRDDFRLELFPGAVKQAMASSHAKSRDLWQVPVANIRIIDGFNVRIRDAKYDEKIDELAKSILAEGFYQDKPLAGYVAKENGENVIFVTDGHRRYEATLKAITAGAQIEKFCRSWFRRRAYPLRIWWSAWFEPTLANHCGRMSKPWSQNGCSAMAGKLRRSPSALASPGSMLKTCFS